MQLVQEQRKRYERLMTLILGRKQMQRKTWRQVAGDCGLGVRCLIDRGHYPERFRLSELFGVADALGISPDEIWDSLKTEVK